MEKEERRIIAEKVISELFGGEDRERVIQDFLEQILGEKLRSVSLDLKETKKLDRLDQGEFVIFAENFKGEKIHYKLKAFEAEDRVTMEELYEKYAKGAELL